MTILGDSFLNTCLSPFLGTGITLGFFQSPGTFPLSMKHLKIGYKDSKIGSPKNLNMRILVISS